MVPLGDRISEKKMFGGLSFMCHAKKCIGVLKDQITLQVVQEKMESVLATDGVTPINFTGESMKEVVFMSPEEIDSTTSFKERIDLGIAHVRRVSGQ